MEEGVSSEIPEPFGAGYLTMMLPVMWVWTLQ
jgi:hypothetical protein